MTLKVIDDPEKALAIRIELRKNGGCCIGKEQSDETRCICMEFIQQPTGVCRCGLYEKIPD